MLQCTPERYRRTWVVDEMKEKAYYMVDSAVLPEVFSRVVEAKRLLSQGIAGSTAEAVRRVGLSRSAFYKYKDSVSLYHDTKSQRIITIHAILQDRPGVLMSFIGAFSAEGANILTINQNIPVSGMAVVYVSAQIESMDFESTALLERLLSLEGVDRIEPISGE